MEITKDIKVKIFAGYLGQKIDAINPLLPNTSGIIQEVNLNGFVKTLRADNDYHTNTIGVCTLMLKPLNKMTDEDAIEVAKIMGFDLKVVVRDDNGCFLFICERLSPVSNSKIRCPKHYTDSIDLLEGGKLFWDDNSAQDGSNGNNSEVSLHCYQYLQSKGYALPYMQYSVDDLVEAKIYKLEK